MCRYMSAVYGGRNDLKTWTTRKILLMYTCSAFGFLDTKRMRSLLADSAKPVASLAGDEGGDRPSMKQHDKAMEIRGVAENQLHLACLMYGDDSNRQKQTLLTTLLGSLADWHGQQNKELRTASASIPWMLQQLNGGLWGHIKATLRAVENTGAYDAMGIQTCWKQQHDTPKHHPMIKENDDLSTLAWELCVSIVRHRLSRTLCLLEGWPHKCVLLLDPAKRGATFAELRADYEIHLQLRACPQAWAKRIVARSAFETRSLQQIVLACEMESWTMTERLREGRSWHLSCRRSVNHLAQVMFEHHIVCECVFNAARSHQGVAFSHQLAVQQRQRRMCVRV